MADLSDAFVAMPGSTILEGVVARSTCRMTLQYPFCKEPEIWNRRNGLNLVQGAS